MFRKREKAVVLAEHGRWISRLHDDVKVLDHRLHRLERRVSTVEEDIAKLVKLYYKLDIAVCQLELGRRAGRCVA